MPLSFDLALAALILAASARATPAPPSAPASAAPALASFGFVDRHVELSSSPRDRREAKEGASMRLGERVRTAAEAMVRLDLPWMTLTLSPGSAVRLADDYLLAAVLEKGRVQVRAEQREMLKLVTGEAEVRGRGWVVVRHERNATLVSALSGRFFVEGSGRIVSLPAGRGTIVRAGKPPLSPMPLPDPPAELSPGSDPRFGGIGEPVSLSWRSPAAAHQVEVLPLGSEEVLIQRDVGPPPWLVAIPWRGAFRWRVAARDEHGLEGRPSAEGLICIDE
jgi:hypothetical protein